MKWLVVFFACVLCAHGLDKSPRPPSSPSIKNYKTAHSRSSGPMPGDIIEGDIVLTADTAAMMRGESRNAMANVKKWPGGVVPYILDASVDDYLEKQIDEGIKHYHKYTCLRFVKRTTEVDYIRVVKPASGCNSMVGAVGGEQVLNMGDGCQYVGLVLHEFGHAIGYFHEHNRPDRDDTINVLWDNVQPWFKDAFHKYTFSEADTQGFPYDLTSIMHYENGAFGKSGFCKTTITVKKDPSYEIRPVYLREFSPQDIKKINKLYNCPTNQLPPVVLPGTNNPDPNACVCEDKYDKCSEWATSGECSRNNAWMSNNCPKSCRTCGEPASDCKDEFPVACNDWAQQFECSNSPQWMNANCAKTCGACGTGVPPTEDPNACENKYDKCPSWASTKECSANFDWMHKNCKKACRVCGEPQTDCMDLYPQACADWGSAGECAKNPNWMDVNCKKTCKACGSTGTDAPPTNPPQTQAPQTQPPQTQAPQTPPAPTTLPDCTDTPPTDAPQTQPPQTQPPQTQPPQTQPPQTQPPQTQPPSDCKDIYSGCTEWKGYGWCNDGQHDAYMKSVCPKSCNHCTSVVPGNCKADVYPQHCPDYKGWGWCNDGSHDSYMKEVCDTTCHCSQ